MKQYEEEIQNLRRIIEESKKGHGINAQELGKSIKMQNVLMGGTQSQREESVEELMAKLAQKGKKVKLLDESASVKELPANQEVDDDGDLEREDDNGSAPSSVKKKMNKIKS